jgi:hypothetical protein
MARKAIGPTKRNARRGGNRRKLGSSYCLGAASLRKTMAAIAEIAPAYRSVAKLTDAHQLRCQQLVACALTEMLGAQDAVWADLQAAASEDEVAKISASFEGGLREAITPAFQAGLRALNKNTRIARKAIPATDLADAVLSKHVNAARREFRLATGSLIREVRKAAHRKILLMRQQDEPVKAPPMLASVWNGKGKWKYGADNVDVDIERNGDTVTLKGGTVTLTLPLTSGSTAKVDKKAEIRAYDVKGSEDGDDLNNGGKPTNYSYYKVFELIEAAESTCASWGFIQLKQVKRKRKSTTPANAAWIQVEPPLGQDPEAWSVDANKAPSGHIPNPEYPKLGETATPAMGDGPGLAGSPPVPAGQIDRVEAKFRTWIVCLSPTPISLLGYFEWGMTVEVEGKDPPAKPKANITGEEPKWHKTGDAGYAQAEKEFKRIVSPEAYPPLYGN